MYFRLNVHLDLKDIFNSFGFITMQGQFECLWDAPLCLRVLFSFHIKNGKSKVFKQKGLAQVFG